LKYSPNGGGGEKNWKKNKTRQGAGDTEACSPGTLRTQHKCPPGSAGGKKKSNKRKEQESALAGFRVRSYYTGSAPCSTGGEVAKKEGGGKITGKQPGEQ